MNTNEVNTNEVNTTEMLENTCLIEKPTQKMSIDQTGLFLAILTGDDISPVMSTEFAKAFLGPIGTILWARIKPTGVEMSGGLGVWLSELSMGVPGNAVLWAYTMKCMFIKNDCKKITLNDWVRHFPNGVPTDETLSACWDAQKINGRNLLDTAIAWEMSEGSRAGVTTLTTKFN